MPFTLLPSKKFPSRKRPSSAYLCALESLESRTLLSVTVAANLKSATYTDVDGDHVTITTTGTFAADGSNFTTTSSGSGDQLQEIDLTDPGFDLTNLTVKVTRAGGGDGIANIGYINATGRNLGAISIQGDLAKIDAGNGDANIPAIKSLSVRSMGLLGTGTQTGGSDLNSTIDGTLSSLNVSGDVKDISLTLTSTHGLLAALSIGGSLIGGSSDNQGAIHADRQIGTVKIGHDIQGGSGAFSGSIVTGGDMASFTVGGSLFGGDGNNSGYIQTGVGMGAVKIAGTLVGSGITGSNSLDSTGFILSTSGRIASVTIGGSIIAGTDTSTGNLTNSGTIRANFDIGSLSVAGSVVGNAGSGGITFAVISARTSRNATLNSDLALGSLTVGGRVEWASILAGYDLSSNPVNADAQIGPVKVGGNWIASNLVAGASSVSFPTFGDINDAPIAGGTPAILSSIASVTITGNIFGTPDSFSNTDHFGFVAQRIGSFKAGGISFTLTPTPLIVPLALGTTSDVTIDLLPTA